MDSESTRMSSISPPPKRRRISIPDQARTDDGHGKAGFRGLGINDLLAPANKNQSDQFIVQSPVQLNFVEELTPKGNIDTISLGSILGDVMIRECWMFNYLFDVDFIMRQFDTDVRDLVKIHLVHGSWKKEDGNRIQIEKAIKRYPNVDAAIAYMPEAYGTHHSKMCILFRHDDLAQIVIMTANFIQQDWCMSQAIWKSPLLPLLKGEEIASSTDGRIGGGSRFKTDLLSYLKTYGTRLRNITGQLEQYDFVGIRAALLASCPGKQNLRTIDADTEPLWGWPGLRNILRRIPSNQAHGEQSQINIQISSVASLGVHWLFSTLLPALSASKPTKNTGGPQSMSGQQHEPHGKPRFSIIFPTAAEIRRSVNGYASGSSIHFKYQTTAQAKQLDSMQPMLCHWGGFPPESAPAQHQELPKVASAHRQTYRKDAVPHIKTYIRFSDANAKDIDWAIMTSANLSTQAWGKAESPNGEVRVSSYEIGVVVWPALWDDAEARGEEGTVKVRMIPTFGTDMPSLADNAQTSSVINEVNGSNEAESTSVEKLVAWRMPYDLPLVPYDPAEKPWCNAEACNEPDWLGRVWIGRG